MIQDFHHSLEADYCITLEDQLYLISNILSIVTLPWGWEWPNKGISFRGMVAGDSQNCIYYIYDTILKIRINK